MKKPITSIEYRVLKSSTVDDDIPIHLHVIDGWPYPCIQGKIVRTYIQAIRRIDAIRATIAPRKDDDVESL